MPRWHSEFRVSLKKGLQEIADREARSISQICEMLLSIGTDAYRKEGTKYLNKFNTGVRDG